MLPFWNRAAIRCNAGLAGGQCHCPLFGFRRLRDVPFPGYMT
jgi:hypothetical protein